jgi:hypothetical protein
LELSSVDGGLRQPRTMIAESAVELVSVLAPLLVVLAVAAVVASASAAGVSREVEAQVDAQAEEWALFVFGTTEDAGQLVAEPTPGLS